MSELDELVDESRGHTPFAENVVRDTSNRSGRDWPWWSVEVERREEDGVEKRRLSATVRLNSTQFGEPGSFEGEWPLPWQQPTRTDLRDAMIALLNAARASISKERRPQQS
jgi:hypothetical protein